MQLIESGWDGKTQIIKPCLVNHGKLRNRINTVIFIQANPGSPHLFRCRKTINPTVIHRDCTADFRVFLENF